MTPAGIKAEIAALLLDHGTPAARWRIGATHAVDEGLEQHGVDLEEGVYCYWDAPGSAAAALVAAEWQARGMGSMPGSGEVVFAFRR